MTVTGRRLLTALGAASLLAAPTGVRADKVVDRSSSQRPSWLTSVPAASRTHEYFVGIKTGAVDLDEGRDSAYKAAAAQAASFVRAKITSKYMARNTRLENRINDELRESSAGRLQGAAIKDLYWERSRSGGWLSSKDRYDVWVLIQYSIQESRRERERLRAQDGEFSSRMDTLSNGLGKFLNENHRGQEVQVSGFQETVSRARHPFSRIVEESLKSGLSGQRVPVALSGSAPLLVEGSYWQAADHVELSAKIVESQSGRMIFTRTVRLPQESVEPLWITGDEDDVESFFAQPAAAASRGRTRGGSISVRSEPPGARIYVDGADRGAAPTTIMGLEPGVRSVALTLDGYVPASREVSVEENEKAALRLDLVRQTGVLSVQAIPKGAQVLIDDKIRGTTPLRLVDLPTGRYGVELKLKNHKPWKQSVEIEYQKTTSLDPTLKEEDGSLAILIEPEGARVSLDGEVIGQSRAHQPLLRKQVSAGAHTISAEKSGRRAKSWQVRVRPFQTATVTGVLAVAEAETIPEPPAPSYRERSKWRRDDSPSWLSGFKLDRPDNMIYLNYVGAAVGDNFYNIRILEAAYYGYGSTFGIGTSLIDLTGGGWKMTKKATTSSNPYQAPTPVKSQIGVSMVSIFPIKLYLTPFAHAYGAMDKKIVSSAQLYVSACYWASPNPEGESNNESSGKQGPLGSVLDYGVLLHLGAFVGMRVGVVEAQVKGYTTSAGSYGGFHDKKAYIAADISLGAFVPGN